MKQENQRLSKAVSFAQITSNNIVARKKDVITDAFSVKLFFIYSDQNYNNDRFYKKYAS